MALLAIFPNSALSAGTKVKTVTDLLNGDTEQPQADTRQ